ncbi:MAG TPA: hypothetical protein VND65_20700 [Candidatus Binatia bacterium]|nr:hypothetical protein [Candidatus Binatia bacterium]
MAASPKPAPVIAFALRCLRLLPLAILALIFASSAPSLSAQDDSGEMPLGDVARHLRKRSAQAQSVIDNDNLAKVADDAASRRAAGEAPVFSLDPQGKGFHVSSPDVTCSLSFTPKSAALLADPVVVDELPRAELAKLDGPATIDGDSLEIALHNGTGWDLKEIVIGLTILRPENQARTQFNQARILPAVAGSAQDQGQKQPDMTILLHVKGSAAPSATATFRTELNFALFPEQEWHWAIVRAKGVAPTPLPETVGAQPALDALPLSIPIPDVEPVRPAAPGQNPGDIAPKAN